jgi:hypothetical protein
MSISIPFDLNADCEQGEYAPGSFVCASVETLILGIVEVGTLDDLLLWLRPFPNVRKLVINDLRLEEWVTYGKRFTEELYLAQVKDFTNAFASLTSASITLRKPSRNWMITNDNNGKSVYKSFVLNNTDRCAITLHYNPIV